ncbi:MAG: urea transporter, urea binding protein [Holophagaceae bacterium]|nr:urea transporter, urea binding protein [Holophagaceae bacterium]
MGQGGLFGIQAAVEDLNRQGGAKVGRKRLPVRIFWADGASDPETTRQAAEELIKQHHVQFLVKGDEPPPIQPPLSQVADRYRIPFIAGVGPIEPWLGMKAEDPRHWPHTWALGFSISSLAPPEDFRSGPGYTVRDTWFSHLEMLGSRTNQKVGILAADDQDGQMWYASFIFILAEQGFQAIGGERSLGLMPLGTVDFSKVFEQWRREGVEVVWGNGPNPFLHAFMQSAGKNTFRPKFIALGRGVLNYDDIRGWGDDLAEGICTEVWWHPNLLDCLGFAGTTPRSLDARWRAIHALPAPCTIGPAYGNIQVLVDALERAGSLDPKKVMAALRTTDLKTLRGRVKFDRNQFSRGPLVLGQWRKKPDSGEWELKVIHSDHTFWPVESAPLVP